MDTPREGDEPNSSIIIGFALNIPWDLIITIDIPDNKWYDNN